MATEIKVFKNDPSFYQVQSSSFRNSLYSLNISIEKHFIKNYLNNDFTRITYAQNNYALRQRAIGENSTEAVGQQTNNLNLPFINYRVANGGMNKNTTRPWFNPTSNIEGVFIDDLNRKIRMSPIKIQYESTFWLYTDLDMQYIFNQLKFENDIEIRIPYLITIDGVDLKMPAIARYNLQFDPLYNQMEWLKTNQIHSISINFDIDTYLIRDNVNVGIPNTILFEFATTQQGIIAENFVPDETYQLIVDRFNEVTIPV